MLLMRLAPLLPIPVDAHWYVAGTTPVRYWEFFAAHFIGTLKVAILDAYLGSLLLQVLSASRHSEAQTLACCNASDPAHLARVLPRAPTPSLEELMHSGRRTA